jgi:murein DD-endopeptidase MepM/ murein hydrolase activator NlpD
MSLDLPLNIDYAWGGMTNLAVDGGGVNTWFDHNRPDYSQNGSLTRYDGAVLTGASPSNCTLSSTCYDGHNGIDFSTDGQTGKPVYAAYSGTVSTLWSSCGNEQRITVDSNTVLQNCHLASYVVTGGSVSIGQLVAYSGNTGNVGPHLHFSVYNSAVSGWPAVDPFGWAGSGSDPWSNDRGYLWSGSYPSFIGGSMTFINSPNLVGTWHSFSDPVEGRTAYYATAGSGAYAWWPLPTYNKSCFGLEVWVPANDATDTSTRYVINYADGTPSATAYVDQNANTSWVTIDPGNGRISSVYVYTNSGSGDIGAERVMSACYNGIFG